MNTSWMSRAIAPYMMALLISLAALPARSGNHVDPSGVSFTYPDDWVVIDKAGQALVTRNFTPEVQSWLQNNHVDLGDKVKLLLLHNSRQTDFVENLNVVVQPGEPPINSRTVDEVMRVASKQYTSLGVPIKDMTGRLQTYGSNRAVVLEYRMTPPGQTKPIMQRQIMIPGGGKLFIVTCSTKPEVFASFSPIFDGILSSMKVPEPTVRGFDWNSVIQKAITGGIIGALVGVMLWVVKKFSKPKTA